MKKKMKLESWPVEAKAGLALVLTSAFIVGGALVLGNRQGSDLIVDKPISSDSMGSIDSSSEEDVSKNEETLIKPFKVEAKAERYFYDINDDSSIRMKAIVPVPNKPSTYMKSVGVDYVFNKQSFYIISATSGVVTEKITDSTYGNMLVIKHETGLEVIYASLGTMLVSEGDEISQGDKIATSGESLYTSGLGSCLHFELVKDDTYLNPEKSYTFQITKL